MPENKEHKVAPLEDGDGASSACQKALAETCKALKAFSFYPENHPLRDQLLQGAYKAIVNLTQAGRVCLIVQRNGFSFADRQAALDNTPMTKALAQQLFARELQRLTFLPELSLDEFNRFLSLLSILPQDISPAGGMAGMLKESGIRGIVVNEIDITAVYTKKKVGEAAENEAATKGTETREDQEQDLASSPGSLSDPLDQLSIEELMAAMSAEADDDKFHQLARRLLAKGRALKSEGNFDRLYLILLGMVQQNADAARSAARRESALMVLQQLSLGETTEHLLNHLEDKEFGQKETVYLILNHLGAEVVDAVIRRLVAAGSKPSKKWLATALVRIGSPALPALNASLKDGRWQVVHAAVAILGEIGNREAVKGLILTASHSDSRVRMESIRALAKLGGMEATTVLIGLLRDENQAVGIQTVTWLGHSRNHAALQSLIQLVMKRDFLGKSQPLKKEALVAIGRIGDRRALDPLFKLVRRRYWILPSRWDELKLLAVEAIGNLGGEPARVFLQGLAARNGHLARASQAALESMEQRNVDHE